MIRRILERLCVLSCLILPLGFANTVFADAPIGTYAVGFSGALSVWDASGVYDGSFYNTDIDYMVLAMDAKGKIEGTGHASSYIDDIQDYIEFDFTVTGKAKSSKYMTKVSLKIKFTGVYEPLWVNFKGGAVFKGEVFAGNPASMRGSIKAKVSGGGVRARTSDALDLDLPSNMTGAWTLDMQTTDVDGKNFTGTGSVELSNGEVIDDFTVKGKFNAKKDESKITLRSATAPGNKVTLSRVVAQGASIHGTLNCKLLGQKRKGEF